LAGQRLIIRRVEEIEQKIGAGLIEEVVQMAESELKLVDYMLQAKPYVSPRIFPLTNANTRSRWEELEEKPVEGQWTYFDRN
jgi:NADH dehydrogenase (ubiquinone) 1 alpha subcomplex subunit 5